MLVITKNTNAQWRLGNWCMQHSLDARPRTLDGALAQDAAGGWSVIADPGVPALIRGVQAFSERHANSPRLKLIFVGAWRPLNDAWEQRRFEELADLVWVTHVAWPSRSEELRRILERHAASPADPFAACAAHELVTPLATLRGWCELLARAPSEQLAERAATALPVVRRSVSQLERVVADLRDIERLRADSFSLELSRVDVNAVAKAATDSMLPLATDKGVLLGTVLASGAPQVRGDETRLLQVLHNLLANSLKFTPSGGRIDVSVTEEDALVLLTVTDTGKGLSASELQQLFARSILDTRAPLRSGLGLMIARQIIVRHQGEIRARSPGANQGTSMIVSLPASTRDE